MAKKLKDKIKAPLGLEHELIPFAGSYHHFSVALGGGGYTKWGADSGQTDIALQKVKKLKQREG